jgi:hypothetical protein
VLVKIVLFDIRIFALSIILAVANVFIYGKDESTLFSVLLGLVLFGVVWLVWLLGNLFIILTTRIKMEEGEKRELVELANLIPENDGRNKNGLLVLTDQHLYYKTYLFTKNKESIAYPLSELKSVKLIDRGFIERYYMEVVTRSKATYLFNIYAGKRWQKLLEAHNVRVKVEKK